MGVKQQVCQVLNVRKVGLQVFLPHPVVVKVCVAGLGRGERCPEKPVAGAFRQVLAPDQTAAIRLLRRSGRSQSAAARAFSVSRQTVWRAERQE